MKLILAEEREKDHLETISSLENQLHSAQVSLEVAEKKIGGAPVREKETR